MMSCSVSTDTLINVLKLARALNSGKLLFPHQELVKKLVPRSNWCSVQRVTQARVANLATCR